MKWLTNICCNKLKWVVWHEVVEVPIKSKLRQMVIALMSDSPSCPELLFECYNDGKSCSSAIDMSVMVVNFSRDVSSSDQVVSFSILIGQRLHIPAIYILGNFM